MRRSSTDMYGNGHEGSGNVPSKQPTSSNGSSTTLVDLNTERSLENQQDGTDAMVERETLLKCAQVARTRIISLTSQESLRPRKYVQWGVKWHRKPLIMVSFALFGVALAIGHHFYYSELSGSRARSERRQQWAHAFGNALAILVVTALAAGNRAAYKQYMWTLVRRKPFSLRSIDGLFSLTSDPLSFFNLELLKHAPIAALLAVLCW